MQPETQTPSQEPQSQPQPTVPSPPPPQPQAPFQQQVQAQPQALSQDQPQWQYVSGQTQSFDGQKSVQNKAPVLPNSIKWTASEFIAYQKGRGWYFLAALGLIVTGGIIFLVTRDYVSTVVIIVLGILLVSVAARQPRTLTYEISSQGIKIGDRLYGFSTLRSFAIIDEGSIHSIDLLPLQRFMPVISMYYAPQDEQAIVRALGGYLPMENRNQPLIDKLMHRLRF